MLTNNYKVTKNGNVRYIVIQRRHKLNDLSRSQTPVSEVEKAKFNFLRKLFTAAGGAASTSAVAKL